MCNRCVCHYNPRIHEADPLVQLFMLFQPTSETYFLFFYQYLTKLKITVGLVASSQQTYSIAIYKVGTGMLV